MKKLKYFLFLFIIFIVPNVFAKDVTNYIQYDTDNPIGTYKGDEISLGGINDKFDVKTRYNGKLSFVEFVLSSNYFDFDTNTTYTITLNMATNDWRNNFMGPQVIKLNSNGSQQTSNGSLSVSNFQFVSRKSIKFNFKTNGSISPYLLFRLYSTDYASTNNIAITGDTNWNLSSIVITSFTSSGGSSSGGSSTGGGSSISCSNGLVVSSSSYNYSNVDISSKYLDSSGQQVSHNSFGIISYIPVSPNSTYYLTRNLSTSSTTNYCLYNSSKTLISCSQYGSSTSYTINTGNASYISLSVRDDYVLTLGTCKSPIDNQNQNTQNIIDNENQNTTNIIENNNDNTQQIIDNQNQNTQQQIDSQRVCKSYDKTSIVTDGKYLNNRGVEYSNGNVGITDYISLYSNSIFITTPLAHDDGIYACYYNSSKELISCVNEFSFILNNKIIPPANSSYIRFSLIKSLNKPIYEICSNGNQVINDTLTDSNVDSGTGTGFFDNFTDQDFGLSQIITIPLNTIQSLTSKTCVPLQVPIPFTNSNVTLPCMTEIYQSKFPSIYNLWKIVSFGIIAYLIAIDIFHIVKGFKDPESDKVEVLDL